MIRSEERRGSRFEISTNTRDPNLQLVFADPYGSLTQLGIPIPVGIPSFYSQNYANRYLFLLVSVKFAEGETARLVGMRQRVLIGTSVPNGEGDLAYNYPIYIPQTTPDWHFSDANISWHLRRVPQLGGGLANAGNAAELAFRQSDTPSLLFENAPGDVGGYGPPDGGRPPGDVVIPELANFHDLRFPWSNDHAWDSLDIEIQGPCAINLYASVQQTNPDTRPALSGSATLLLPEEQFIATYTSAIYTKIAGSLIFERPNLYAEAPQLPSCDNPAPDTPSRQWRAPLPGSGQRLAHDDRELTEALHEMLRRRAA